MRRPALAAAAFGLGIAGVITGLAASGVLGQDKGTELTLQKQTQAALETSVQATGNANTPAPKYPITVATSCPDENSLHPKTGIWAIDHSHGSPDKAFPYVENAATTFASDGHAYTIYAGAVKDDREQGALRVWLIQTDPCAIIAGIATITTPIIYKTPSRAGPATITQIDRDAVAFQTADGTTGRLNFLTGTFE
jgi:hypothetical protein